MCLFSLSIVLYCCLSELILNILMFTHNCDLSLRVKVTEGRGDQQLSVEYLLLELHTSVLH